MPKITNPFAGITGGANPSGGIGGVIGEATKYIFGAAALLLLIYLAMGGLQLMTSRGDPKAVQAAHGKITNALIGFAIVVLAGAIVLFFGNLLNLNVFTGLIK